jgi:DivIVA domain-containing protein
MGADSSLTPESIQTHSFASGFRGYDPEQVRQYLTQVANEVRSLRERTEQLESAWHSAEERAARPPVLDEDTLMAAVGEETAAILRTARAAAADMRAKANEQAEQLVAEARARSTNVSGEADAILARATRSAEEAAARVVESARSDGAKMLEKARADADAIRAAAQQEKTLTIEGATLTRERILEDLSRRRRVASVQIEQLRAGRERLIESYAMVRKTLDEVQQELSRADTEARAAAEDAGRRIQRSFEAVDPVEAVETAETSEPAPTAESSADDVVDGSVDSVDSADDVVGGSVDSADDVVDGSVDSADDVVDGSVDSADDASDDDGEDGAFDADDDEGVPDLAKDELAGDEVAESSEPGEGGDGGGLGSAAGQTEDVVDTSGPAEAGDAGATDRVAETPTGEHQAVEAAGDNDAGDSVEGTPEDDSPGLVEAEGHVAGSAETGNAGTGGGAEDDASETAAGTLHVSDDVSRSQPAPSGSQPNLPGIAMAAGAGRAHGGGPQAARAEVAHEAETPTVSIPHLRVVPDPVEGTTGEVPVVSEGDQLLHTDATDDGESVGVGDTTAEGLETGDVVVEVVEGVETGEVEAVVVEAVEGAETGEVEAVVVEAVEGLETGEVDVEPGNTTLEGLKTGEVQTVEDGQTTDDDEVVAGAADAGGVQDEAGQAEAVIGEAPVDAVASNVDLLFARIRAGRDATEEGAAAGPVPEPAAATEPELAATGPSAASQAERPAATADWDEDDDVDAGVIRTDADEALLQRREALIMDLEISLTRKLKRSLQDEQNDLLDRLRSLRAEPTAARLLPSPDEQAARYVSAAQPLVDRAAAAGAAFANEVLGQKRAPGPAPVVVDLAKEAANNIVDALRRRLEQAIITTAEDDQAVLVEAVGGAYREWKSQRIERLAGDALAAAFSRGTWHAVPDGTYLRWVVEDVDGPCPDCDDDALAGSLPKDEPFPTGQYHPPAHTGCRCLLVPTE